MALARRALEIYRDIGQPDNPVVADLWNAIGHILSERLGVAGGGGRDPQRDRRRPARAWRRSSGHRRQSRDARAHSAQPGPHAGGARVLRGGDADPWQGPRTGTSDDARGSRRAMATSCARPAISTRRSGSNARCCARRCAHVARRARLRPASGTVSRSSCTRRASSPRPNRCSARPVRAMPQRCRQTVR